MNNSIAWIASGVLGLVVGVGGAALGLQWLGYEQSAMQPSGTQQPAGPTTGGAPGKMGGAPSATQGGAGGGGGGMAGMMGGQGGTGGMMGGAGGASAGRNLATIVGKLDLLTQGVHIELTAEQQESLASLVADIDEPAEFTEDEAKTRLDEINELFSDEQRKTLDSVELPRRRGSGGPGGLRSDGGAAAAKKEAEREGGKSDEAAIQETMRAKQAGPLAGGAGAAPNPNANPFKQEENAKRLAELRQRLKSGAR